MIENTGAEAYLMFTLAGTPVTARLRGRLEEGTTDAVGLDIDKSALCLFDAKTERRIDLRAL